MSLALAQFTLGPLTLGDVTDNVRDPYDTSALIFYRRDGQRNRNQFPIFPRPHGFVLRGALQMTDMRKDHRRLFHLTMVGRDKNAGRAPDDFRRRVTKEPLRAGVPTGDKAAQVEREHRVLRRFDDRRQIRLRHLRLVALGDVYTHTHETRIAVELN